MIDYICQHRKIRYYFIILAVLWSGTLVNAVLQLYPTSEVSLNTSEKTESSVLYTKGYEGQLSLAEKEKISTILLDRYQATIVDAIQTESLYTVYAYSDDMDETIQVGEDLISLNIVFYYNEITNETVVIVASPIYNEDF